MKIILIILLIAVLSSCSVKKSNESHRTPEGELFAYFRVTQGAFSGTTERATGFYFYKEGFAGVAGPILNIYELRNGVIVDSHSTGSISAEVLADIDDLNFEPFDYEIESKRTEEKIKQLGGFRELWVTADGQEWEIMINTDQGEFLMKEWNPGSGFRNYAKHSEHIGKLEKVVRRLLMYYGEAVIGVL